MKNFSELINLYLKESSKNSKNTPNPLLDGKLPRNLTLKNSKTNNIPKLPWTIHGDFDDFFYIYLFSYQRVF